MTIGWAIVVVAILYLLDKHNLMRKALKLSAIALAIIVVGYGCVLGWEYLQERWDARQQAREQVTMKPNDSGSPIDPSTIKPLPQSTEPQADPNSFRPLRQDGTPPLPPGYTVDRVSQNPKPT